MLGICRDLDNAIARRDGEFIPRRGFMEIRERNGPGSVPRDARWRWRTTMEGQRETRSLANNSDRTYRK